MRCNDDDSRNQRCAACRRAYVQALSVAGDEGEFRVLQDVSVRVCAGKVVALLVAQKFQTLPTQPVGG